jgi:hypothetical protein
MIVQKPGYAPVRICLLERNDCPGITSTAASKIAMLSQVRRLRGSQSSGTFSEFARRCA